MRYSWLISLLLALSSFFLFPCVTHADFEAADNTVSGSIHIDPENKPVANASLQMVLQLKDTQNHFQLKNCTCTLTITQPNRLPYTQLVTVPNKNAPDTNTVKIPYLFPSPATYTFTLTGIPTDNASFQPFTLKWQIPVGGKFVKTPKATGSHGINTTWWYVSSIVVILVGIVYWQFFYPHKRKRSS
jgi:hypothetical protein